jgi:RTX calcium-binding nonapeptide repeat (4 copies)
MSLLRRGGRRTKARGVLVTVFSLAAFQVLAIIGAGSALAISACTYNPATDTINITIDPDQAASVAVETASDDVDADSPAGAILFTASDLGGLQNYENGAASTQCGSASTSNTVAIIVLGQPSASEYFLIDEWSTGGQFPATIAWAVDLGSNPVGGLDELDWWGNDGSNPGTAVPRDDTVVATDTTFDLNGAVGEMNGVEFFYNYGGDGDDVIDHSALASVIGSANGADDDDWLAPGALQLNPVAFGGLEFYTGDADVDTLSYGHRTTSTFVDNGVTAGLDANADGDNADTGDEFDLIDCFEVVETGSGNDTILALCGPTTAVPGDGDDDITGNGDDWIDWSSSSAGMVIDIDNETATGQGTDEWTGVTRFVGSAFDDTMLVTTGAPGAGVAEFFGGDGVDTVDGSAGTTGQTINLDILDPTGDDDLENAIGGSGSDDVIGNDIRNSLFGMDGNDFLFGDGGNDVLDGGLGNDDFFGEDGADKVSYASNTVAGVNVDVVLGFATSSESGDDGFTDAIEIIQGSPFNDSITGGGGLTTTNFLFAGGNGKDNLTGSGSNDTLKGGKGNDRLRGLEGGDTLKGGKGKKDRGWGGPGVDFCTGVEIERGCE